MKGERTLDRICEWVRVALVSKLGFWSEELLDFSTDPSKQGVVSAGTSLKRKWLVVVAREFYYETVTDYPIGNLADLKKAIKLQRLPSPYAGRIYRYIERLTPQSHRVTSWVVRDYVFESLDFKPIWVIPETACFYLGRLHAPLIVSRFGGRVLVAASNDGLVSGVEPDGAKAGDLKKWRSQFLASEDFATGDVIVKLSDEQSGQKLFNGLRQVISRVPFSFLRPFSSLVTDDFPWGKAGKVSFLVSLMYLLLTSSYLIAATALVDYRMLRIEADSRDSLDLRVQAAQAQIEVEGLQGIFDGIVPKWFAWDLLIDMSFRGVTIGRVDSSDDYVTFYGTANKGTDVLAFLSSDIRVDSAEFSTPVRQTSLGQQFGIKVTFSGDPGLILIEQTPELSGTAPALPPSDTREPHDG